MNILGITPRVALNFTAASLDARVTFTRTTNATNPATYVDSSGYIVSAANDQPRFDYDPLTLSCKGLLVEESKSNLVTYSNDFNSAWGKAALTVNNAAAISPDGTQNAQSAIPTLINTSHLFNRASSIPVTSGVTYVNSFYVKAAGYNYFRIQFQALNFNSNAWANFNLSAGTIGKVGGNGTPLITPVGNGWYRCVLIATATGTGNSGLQPFILASDASAGSESFAGDGTSGIYIYGAQLEAGFVATSYIPTTTTALTRNADVATITGSNFTGFWNSVQGGASVEATPTAVSGISPLVQFDDGTANEIIALRGNTTNPELYIVDGGTPQVQLDAGTIAARTSYNLTAWWAANNCLARKDSGAVVADTTATIPTVTQMRIGSDGTNYLNGTIASINYYDKFYGRIYTRRKNKVFASLL